MNTQYQEVISALQSKGIRAEFHRPHQLVVSNRAWITLCDNQWLICTWIPACYPVPPSVDIVDVCEACLQHRPDPFYAIPDEICTRFGLVRLDNEEMEKALAHIPADGDEEVRPALQQGVQPQRISQWNKYLRLWQQGLLSNSELANGFLDDVESQTVLIEWATLPPVYQNVVRSFLEMYPPHTLKAFRLGPPPREILEQLTQEKQAVASLLVEHLRTEVD
jgi:hypothetical protein